MLPWGSNPKREEYIRVHHAHAKLCEWRRKESNPKQAALQTRSLAPCSRGRKYPRYLIRAETRLVSEFL